jgi:CheY-like chemotaxis protein
VTEDVGANVLIVEDEEAVAETYRIRLAEEYDVTVATSGEEGLDRVDDDTDVVLLDRRMPGTSGDEVLDEIRRRGLDCRVVLVTAVDPDFDIVDMGCDDYVVKPVTQSDLQEAVERALTIAEYNETLQELSALKLKRNVIEVELAEPDLEDSEQYQRLTQEIARLEAELDALEDELDLEAVEMYL